MQGINDRRGGEEARRYEQTLIKILQRDTRERSDRKSKILGRLNRKKINYAETKYQKKKNIRVSWWTSGTGLTVTW